MLRKLPLTAALAAVGVSVALGTTSAAGVVLRPSSIVPMDRGHGHGHADVYIADQFNNRVIIVNPESHQIVWHFGTGSNVAGPHSVVAPNDAEKVGPFMLISGTGAPTGTEPGCGGSNGCPDNRVMLVNPGGHIVWQYGQAGVGGSGFNQLIAPVCAVALERHRFLITDQGNQRVIVVDQKKNILWQYGTTGVGGSGFNQVNAPNSAELLGNGHILIADEGNNRVIEVNPSDNSVVWSYGSPSGNQLNAPAFASRLPGGDTLIADSNNSRAVEIDMNGNVVWTFYTNTRPGSVSMPEPTRAIRLLNGDTLISDQFNHQVIEVTSGGQIVFAQGMIGVPGNGFNQLNAPYDAKVVGQYVGLTPPPHGW